MARHNREGQGQDQLGRNYVVSYQPDWFHQVKVTRNLESGRQSTKTLFRNPGPVEADAGSKVRTRIQSAELGVDVEVLVDDPVGAVRRVTVEAMTGAGKTGGEPVSFVISRRNPRR
jgi:hypothetical protein